jgi:hypothetical protein
VENYLWYQKEEEMPNPEKEEKEKKTKKKVKEDGRLVTAGRPTTVLVVTAYLYC